MIIIIGAGISGLYIGYQLLQKGISDFLILERSNTVGGRIYTTEEDKLELGASIIHTKQKNIMKIIHELGLTNDLFELKGKDTFYCSKSGDKKLDSIKVEEKLNCLNKKLESLANKNKNKRLSLQQLAKDNLSENDYNFYKDYTKEWFEYRDQNAYIVFRSWANTGRICKLKGGLSQIIKKFYVILKDKIRLGYDVKKIERDTQVKDIYIINGEIVCNKVYLCTNYTGAKNIKYKNLGEGAGMSKVLNICKPVSCIRVYVKFKKRVDVPDYIVSSKLFKWCIRISDRILMISYTDGTSANKIYKMGEKKAIGVILSQISECISQKLDENDIVKSYFAYWKEGYDIVKSDVTEKEYQSVISSLPKNFIQTVCPLQFGLNQAWMEAHLLKI